MNLAGHYANTILYIVALSLSTTAVESIPKMAQQNFSSKERLAIDTGTLQYNSATASCAPQLWHRERGGCRHLHCSTTVLLLALRHHCLAAGIYTAAPLPCCRNLHCSTTALLQESTLQHHCLSAGSTLQYHCLAAGITLQYHYLAAVITLQHHCLAVGITLQHHCLAAGIYTAALPCCRHAAVQCSTTAHSMVENLRFENLIVFYIL